MARQPLINTFGKLRPTGADNSGAEVLNRLAGLSSQVGDIAFNIGAKKAQKEGALEGAKSPQDGKLELRDDTFSIRNQAFNQSAILAHRAAIQTDAKAMLDKLEREDALDPQAFETKAAAYKEGTLTDMPEELALLVGQDIDSSIASRKAKLTKEFFKREERNNQAILAEGLESATDDISNAAREGDIERVKELSIQSDVMIDEAVKSLILDPVKAQEIRNKIKEQVSEQSVLSEIDKTIFNEDLSLEEKVQKGQGFIESLRSREIEGFDAKQKDSLTRVIEGKVGDLQRELATQTSGRNIAQEREISNLKVSAKQGFDTAENLIQKTEQLHQEEKISGNERTSILNSIFSGQKKGVKKAQDFSLVAKKLGNRNPEIVLEPNLINGYYDEVYAPALAEMNEDEQIAFKSNFVNVLKAVPSGMKAEIENNLLSGDIDLISQTIRTIDEIDKTPGLVEDAVTPKQRAFAETLVALSQNMTPEQALKEAQILTDTSNKALIESRETEIKDEKYREDYEDWVEDGFESFLGSNFLTNNINKQVVESEFSTLFESFFKAGMTKDRAKDKAIELLQRNWKNSDFGFMKHPPEDYYAVAGETDYIKKQLTSDIRKNFVGFEFEKEDIFLIADDVTAKEAGKGRPTYRVIVRDSNGELQRIDQRWAPDQKTEMERQTKENQESGGKRRKDRTKPKQALEGLFDIDLTKDNAINIFGGE